MCKNVEIVQKNGQQNVSRISALFFTRLRKLRNFVLPIHFLGVILTPRKKFSAISEKESKTFYT